MSFSISGVDLTLETPREGFDSRLLLDVVLESWPEAIFQDANEEGTHPISDLPTDVFAKSKEFFLYEDDATARSWNQDGRTEENANGMLHFLIADDPARSDILQITLVIDELTPAMAGMYNALDAVLQPLRERGRAGRSQPQRIDFDAALRAAGWPLPRVAFYELVEELRMALFPGWTQDELACHPYDAARFCDAVRLKARAHLPDNIIMKAMLNRRKRKTA